MSILQTIDLKKYYGTEPNITRALDGVNFSVEDGEFVAVVGTSGSGKSTLLHMMGGLDTPTSGTVIVRDKELSKMNDVSDKYAKVGYQVSELFDDELLKEKVARTCESKNVLLEHLYHKPLIDPDDLLETLHSYRDMIAPYVCDVSSYLWNALKEGKIGRASCRERV